MEIKIPEIGESIFEALVAKWHKRDGDKVLKNEPVCELETDKITLELNAENDGVLSIVVPEGETVKIGAIIGKITEQALSDISDDKPPVSPAVRKIAAEKRLDLGVVSGTGLGGRILVEDLISAPEEKPMSVHSEEPPVYKGTSDERVERVPMTQIRKRIAERLLAARNSTAMLTTFNEADLFNVIELRKKHKEHFQKKHGVTLGFMPFFVKACCEALKEFPAVNARIDGDDIVYHHYYDISIAIAGEKGLVAPVLRDADRLRFFEIEQKVEELITKVKENHLSIADLLGGTFSITNGGVFGSLLSTPILNPPQSGVLGMHAVQERPVARDGLVIIRPMMYLALTYDHRIIDGREAVGFLKRIKEYIEDPEELFLEG